MGVGIKMSMYKSLKTYYYASPYLIQKSAYRIITNA